MILWKVFLALLLWSVPTVATGRGETCDNDALLNEPIGIDLGHHLVSAAYAYSLDNLTFLGAVGHQGYQQQIMELAMDHFGQSGWMSSGKGSWSTSTPLALLGSAVGRLFEGFDAKYPISSHPYIAWTRDSLQSLRASVFRSYEKIPSPIRRHIKAFLESRGLLTQDFTETLTEVFTELQTTVWDEHGVNITWAIVAVPDFFNEALKHAVLQAGQQAGITILEAALPPRSFCTHYLNPAIDQEARILIIHQGQFHCGAQFYDGSPKRRRARRGLPGYRYMPLMPWASERIQRKLMDELVRDDDHLRALVDGGRERVLLRSTIQETRLALKGYDSTVELMCGLKVSLESQLGGGHRGEEDAAMLDELPLNLDSWWPHGNVPDLVLTRSQIAAVEDEYVESLAGTLQAYLQVTQAFSEPPQRNGTKSLERLDYVIVLTDHFDGELVHRAVQEAFGEGIQIIGSLQEIVMAAEGAARLAWKRRQNLLASRNIAGIEHDEL
ncbi:uncharacterized protein BP01DRAFT_358490 [Aspergillus saccharolyticus JOP 1030-1]|uniref:Uncharacterized protein n=1 Tax=Aspergillus saccharolyticus JOP 1030-1 TaxID=1450539 RepID=A0A318Z8L8_9EURO|nr:hypothetical protein BP01DRAFT_358490 [Aspergillus saccharolyticus JOP 1030-1]PYH43519.1 hypothetical protein BP01DRAFT_358490 [Aspergillus saccharolyticus JOP 1030-1]